MVMVTAWPPEEAGRLLAAPGEDELPGQPRQAVSRTTAARSARRTGERIGAGEHATGRGAGKHDVCAASHGGPGKRVARIASPVRTGRRGSIEVTHHRGGAP